MSQGVESGHGSNTRTIQIEQSDFVFQLHRLLIARFQWRLRGEGCPQQRRLIWGSNPLGKFDNVGSISDVLVYLCGGQGFESSLDKCSLFSSSMPIFTGSPMSPANE